MEKGSGGRLQSDLLQFVFQPIYVGNDGLKNGRSKRGISAYGWLDDSATLQMQLEFIIIGQASRATICHCPENLMGFGRAYHKVFVVLRSGGQVPDFAKGQFRCCVYCMLLCLPRCLLRHPGRMLGVGCGDLSHGLLSTSASFAFGPALGRRVLAFLVRFTEILPLHDLHCQSSDLK